MKLLFKARILRPGSRGGKYWIDKQGKIQYGEKPNERQARASSESNFQRRQIDSSEYKKHGIPEDAKHAYYYEGHKKYTHEWRDSRGRLQRRYQQKFIDQKQAEKYQRINRAIQRIPELREAVNNDIISKDPIKKYTALAIKIIDFTGARVGNEKYTKSNETHGITTLMKDNILFKDNSVILDYTGKKGVHQTHEIDNIQIVESLRGLMQLPGKKLFQIDDKGNISSGGVNKYLANYGLTAKDLRTFRANSEFTAELMNVSKNIDEKMRKKAVAQALKTVSDKIGNTPNVCRTNYISPEILQGYLKGKLSRKFALVKSKGEDKSAGGKYNPDQFDELFDEDELNFIELWSGLTPEDGKGQRVEKSHNKDEIVKILKSHISGHYRTAESGHRFFVRPYENKVFKKLEEKKPETHYIDVSIIERDENQPREEFEQQKLRELSESISKIGLVQPIGLRPLENGKHKIIFGERRWRATVMAGIQKIPAQIFDIKDKKELLAIQVAENLSREDMNPIETANAYKKLHDAGMGYEEIAGRVGVSPLTVQRKLSLTTLISEIQNLIKNGDLPETHGIIIGLAGLRSQFQFEVLKKINVAKKKLSRDELDGIVSRYQQAQNQTSLFGNQIITDVGQINNNKIEAVKRQLANLLGNVVKAAEKIIDNKNYKLAPAILKEEGKLKRTKDELKLLQNYLSTIIKEMETADAFFHSGGSVEQYLAKQNVKREKRKRKRIRKAIFLIKSLVRSHTRTSKTGKLVQVGQYTNMKTKQAEKPNLPQAPKDYDEVVKRYGEIIGTEPKKVANKNDQHFATDKIPESLSEKCKREKPGSGGEIHLSKKEVTTLLRHGIVGFISAGKNPNEKELSESEIEARDKKLRSDLIKQGLKFTKVTGKYGEVEDSYMVMVPNVKDKELIELGKRYNQDSVIYSDHGQNRLIYTTGENAGKSYNGNGFNILNNDAEDFYTEVETKKGKMRFSLKFDFSKLAKSIRYFIKSLVKQHTRKTNKGKLVNVKQYVNRKMKHDKTNNRKTKQKEFKSINDFNNRGEFLDYIKPLLKKIKHPYVVGSITLRPYVVGYGCDGSTDANIHYVAQKMCKDLSWDYAKIYNKAYEWQKRKTDNKWLEGDLSLLKDEALKTKVVKDTTIIPKNTTIQNVLDDLYDINNRSLVAELEDRFEKMKIKLNTKLNKLTVQSAQAETASIKQAKAEGKSFDEWVKGQGEIVYHGTHEVFDKFDLFRSRFKGEHGENLWGFGVYTSPNIGTAKNYGKNILEIPFTPKNPLELSKFKTVKELADYLDVSEDALMMRNGIPTAIGQQAVQLSSKARELGHDSIIAGQEIVILDPSKIKTRSQLKAEWDKVIDPHKIKKSIRYLIKGKEFPVGHVSVHKDGSVWKKVSRRGKPEDWKEITGSTKKRILAQRKEGKLTDFGKKIGGARKDTSQFGYSRSNLKPKKDTSSSWRDKYVVLKRVDGSGWVVGKKNDKYGIATSRDFVFASEKEAEKAIPLYAMREKFRVFKDRNEKDKYSIFKKITDRKLLKIVDRTFTTEEEAKVYMIKHAEELLETKTTFGEEILPAPEIAIRKGETRRDGDATPEMFMKTFKPRGIEFGNWNNQSERQQVLNHSYDALLDLSDILGISPKDLMLGGELAIAFGARGAGLSGAKAHYELDYGVINLTKMKGAGSLGHEYFHALDHYFARKDSKSPSEKIINKNGDKVFKETNTDRNFISHGESYHSKLKPETIAAFKNLMDNIYKKPVEYTEDIEKVDIFVNKAREQLNSSVNAIRKDLKSDLTKTYTWRSNKKGLLPASKEQLAEFDRLAKILIKGKDLKLKYYSSENSRSKYGLGHFSNDTLEAMSKIYKDVRGRSGFDSQSRYGCMDQLASAVKLYDGRLQMVKDAKKSKVKTKIVPTSYAMEAKKMDQARVGDYWSEPHEMAARAFAAYVEDKIKSKGNQSDFLVYRAHGGIIVPMIDGFIAKPYPEKEERTKINKTFDELFKIIRKQKELRKSIFGMTKVTFIIKSIKGYVKPGHKYIRRIGTSGKYKYEYEELGIKTKSGLSLNEKILSQKDKIIEALKYLSSQCDYANSIDGCGFNKYDAQLGHDLATTDNLTDNEINTAFKILKKYTKQIEAGGIKLDFSLEDSGGKDIEKIAESIPIVIMRKPDTDILRILFDFKWGDKEWERIKSKVKEVGAQFNSINKVWEVGPEKIPNLFEHFSDIAISEGGREVWDKYIQNKKINIEAKKAEIEKLPQEIIDWKPNILEMTKEQILKVTTFNSWLKGFMESNAGKDYKRLSYKQQRVVDEAQEKLETFLQQEPGIKKEFYQAWKKVIDKKILEKMQKDKAVNELLGEKNNTDLKLPEFVKKNNLTSGDLWNYQKKGVNWLLKVNKGILGHDVGLGKTIQSIVAAQMVKDTNKRTLVIVPKARLYGWKKEVEKFTDKKAIVIDGIPAQREEKLKQAKDYDFVICTYGMLQDDSKADQLKKLKPGVTIVDEAHRLKGHDTKQSENYDKYLGDARHKYFLTATPMPNRPEEIYQMMRHIQPEVLGSFWKDFVPNYCITEMISIGRGRKINKIIGYRNKDELRKRVAPYMFIKKQDDEDVNLEMPPKREPELNLDMSDDQRKFYNAIQTDAVNWLMSIDRGKFGSKERAMMLTKLLRLEQAAISPKILDNNWKGSSPKIEEVKELVSDHFTNGEKRGIVIFSHFIPVIDLLKKEFQKDGISASEIAVIQGQVSAKQIQEIEDGMASGKYKVLISSDAGSEGLNLQNNTNVMIHMDTPWTPYKLTQREGRIYRQGQKSPVTIYRPMMDESVEQYKQQTINMKNEWIKAIVDGKDTGDIAGKLKYEDYGRILGLNDEQIKALKKPKSNKKTSGMQKPKQIKSKVKYVIRNK